MEKTKKKSNNKTMKGIKICTSILSIILITLISFVGIYNKDKNQIKEYQFSTDINGARTIALAVDASSSTVIKDSEGKEVEDEEASKLTDDQLKEKGYKKETVKKNADENLTAENYKKSKEIIEKRLKSLKAKEYTVAVNEETGRIEITIEENEDTDNIISEITSVGEFILADADTNEVLLNNDNIKYSKSSVDNSSGSTIVNLEIGFDNKDKLEEITKTYTTVNNTTENTTTEESSEEKQKQVVLKIDDQTMTTINFDQVLTTGVLKLTLGQATSDTKTISEYKKQANSIAAILNNEKLPVKYTAEKNQYILSNITEQNLIILEIVIAIIAIIGIIYLVVKHKLNGLLAGCSLVGLAAVYMLLIRYTNVIISIESIVGILSILVLDYILTLIMLKTEKPLNAYKKFWINAVPICAIAVVFSFISWTPLSSFGNVMVWGLVLIAVYNAIVTRSILKINAEN